MIVIDDFLPNFKQLKDYSATAEFSKEANDVDGAVYPAIDFNIPEEVKASFVSEIEKARGFKISTNLMFLRANPEGEKEPYQAHNDLNMGAYTCILYLTEVGGTAFVEHKKTGVDRNIESFGDTWLKDCNIFDAWKVTDFCQMKPNRALFFDAELMHRGQPIEGYGKGSNARMIMVCFYNKA